MARQVGQVIALTEGNRVTVALTKTTMCSHGSCNHRIFPVAEDSLHVQAENATGAVVGDVVEITFATGQILKGAFLVYLLPILVGLMVYGGADALGLSYPALWGLLAAGVSMTGALWVGRRLDPVYMVSRRLDPAAVRLMAPEDCVGCPLR